MAMGQREKTFGAKICDGAGATSSSLTGESGCTTKAQRNGRRGVLVGPMAEIPRWQVEEDLGPKGTPALMGATKRFCGLALRPQLHLVKPFRGFLAS